MKTWRVGKFGHFSIQELEVEEPMEDSEYGAYFESLELAIEYARWRIEGHLERAEHQVAFLKRVLLDFERKYGKG